MADTIFVGRRKSAVARARVTKGSGQFTLNGRTLEDYFTTEKLRAHVLEPFGVLEQDGQWDVTARMHGGGTTGQAGALRLAIARALAEHDGDWRTPLKAGRVPHPRRPSRRAQEVRPQEGPSRAAVQQALTRDLVPHRRRPPGRRPCVPTRRRPPRSCPGGRPGRSVAVARDRGPGSRTCGHRTPGHGLVSRGLPSRASAGGCRRDVARSRSRSAARSSRGHVEQGTRAQARTRSPRACCWPRSLLVPAAASAAPEDEQPTRAVRRSSSRASPPDDFDIGEGTEAREYFVRLADAPAALLHRRQCRGSAPAVQRDDDGTFEFRGDDRSRRALPRRPRRGAGRGPDPRPKQVARPRRSTITGSFTVANNGFTLELTPREAEAIAEFREVTWVQQVPEYELHTDAGPGVGQRPRRPSGSAPPRARRPVTTSARAWSSGSSTPASTRRTRRSPTSPPTATTTPTPAATGELRRQLRPDERPRRRRCERRADPDRLRPDRRRRRTTTRTSPSSATTSSSACGATARERQTAAAPIDYDGHGSHTAGTAAGNFVDGVSARRRRVPVEGNEFDISGVAPRANIISYAACCTGVGCTPRSTRSWPTASTS